MRILVVSDLHLECGAYAPPTPTKYDAVILAGDISSGIKAIEWAADRKTFGCKPVLLVPGNHEFYHSVRLSTLEVMRRRARGTNVHVLDRDAVVVHDNDGSAITILGATLWTDFCYPASESNSSKAERLAVNIENPRHRMPDYGGAIVELDLTRLNEGRRFSAEDSVREHLESRKWLLAQLESSEIKSPIVVVTHHAPCRLSAASKYENDRLTPCFVSDLPPKFFQRPRL